MSERNYSISEVMQILSRKKRTIYTWVKEGRLKAKKLNNRLIFSESDIQDFIKENFKDIETK